MSFDDIETLWRSSHNRPPPDEIEAHRAELGRRLRGRYRAFLVTIGAGVTALLVCAAALVRYGLSGGALDLGREWGSLLLFALPVLGAGVLLAQHRRHRLRHAGYQLSIAASLRAALDENRLARTRMKILGGLYGAVALLSPVIASQLQAVGKARPAEARDMLVLFLALALAVSAALAYHDRRRLLPRKRALEALLSAYEADPSPK
jgi:hypothetical protein